MRYDQIIKKVVLSEKAYNSLNEKLYTLEVALKATKDEIKTAIKNVFSVDVVKVNTSILRGKQTRKARSKKKGPIDVKAPNTKKAFVRLKQGQELPVPNLQETAQSAEK